MTRLWIGFLLWAYDLRHRIRRFFNPKKQHPHR